MSINSELVLVCVLNKCTKAYVSIFLSLSTCLCKMWDGLFVFP